MAKRKHLFYILDPEGRSMVVQNGVVVPSGSKHFLQFAAIGSKDIVFLWERDKEKLGLFRTFSTNLEFIRDGQKILRDVHYLQNEERERYLLIQQFTETYEADLFEEIYKSIYRGRLDFYTAIDNDSSFSISIAENSLVKQMSAGETTVYDHPLSDPECIPVYHDGVKFNYKQNFIIPASQPVNLNDDGVVLVGIQETIGEGTPAGIAFSSVFYEEAEPAPGDLTDDTRYFMRSTQYIESIRIKGSVRFFPAAPGGDYRLYIQTTTGRTIDLVNTPIVSLRFHEYFYDITIQAADNERFFLFHQRTGSVFDVVAYRESAVEIFVTSTFRASYVDAYPINVLHRKAVAKITGSEVYAQSELLNNNDNLLVTSGDGLRGVPNGVVKTSHREIFSAAKVLLFAGQSIEGNRVKIESLERFYKTADAIPLGEVKDFSVSEADDLMYTEIKAGYPSQTLDEVQGKLSFHNTNTYGTPRKSADAKTLSLICPWIACPYAQETLRINMAGKDTTDNSGDNKVYIIDSEAVPDTQFNNTEFSVIDGRYYIRLKDNPALFPFFYKRVTMYFPIFNQTFTILSSVRDGLDLVLEVAEAVAPEIRDIVVNFHVRRIRRPSGIQLSGVPNPETAYNILLSPGTIIRRWQNWLNSLFWHFEGEALPFISTDKNRDVSYSFLGNTIDEDAALTIGSNRYFIPKYFNFVVPVPRDLNELYDAAPHRGFSAIGRGVEVFGFGDKISLALVDGREQQLRLLCGPNVDLSQFA